jgi:restriction system protein
MSVKNTQLLTARQLAIEVELPNTTCRDYLRVFNEFIKAEQKGSATYYPKETVKVLNFIKDLRNSKCSYNDILKILQEYGIVDDEIKRKQIIESLNDSKTINAYHLRLPHLEILSDGKERTASEIREKIIERFHLTEDQINEMNPSGKETKLATSIRWARYDLKKSNLIESAGRDTYKITNEGLQFLNHVPQDYAEEVEIQIDPFDIVKEKHQDIRRDLAQDIIKEVKKAHWTKLEEIVVELLMAMGYGEGKITGKTGDGGIDGIIKEDKLGLDIIYLQAKRWEDSVGRETVQSFSGALDGKGAKKGVFITTSTFTRGAYDYVEKLESKKIILINGKELAEFMMDYDIGVSVREKFIVKKIDWDYFKTEE